MNDKPMWVAVSEKYCKNEAETEDWEGAASVS